MGINPPFAGVGKATTSLEILYNLLVSSLGGILYGLSYRS